MDLGKLVERSLDRAFDTIGSLAVKATFHLKTVTEFDYSAGEPVEQDNRDVTVDAVVLESRGARHAV